MTAAANTHRPFKLGVVGCGEVASYGHLPAIAESAACELHALLDPDPARLAALGERYELSSDALCTDAEAFYAHDLDGVAITSPAPVHLQNVLDAVRHRVPILCEKPLAMSAAEGQEMIAAAEAQGVMLAVAFCYRYSPAAQRIKRLIEDGAIGEPRTLRLVFNWTCHGVEIPGETSEARTHHARRRQGRMLEGGPMVDCGTHQIDLAQWWLDSPIQSIVGHGSWVENYEAPDHTWAHLTHDSGAHTMVEISFSYGHATPHLPKRFHYELIGTEGLIVYDRTAKSFRLHNSQGEHELPYAPEKSFAGLYTAFARALDAGHAEPHLASAAHGLEVTRIAREATNQAIASRTPDVTHADRSSLGAAQ
ncbi:MAG: Gfo/Idh/MocA family oxidoreductase [Planctomycetota bacterium]